MVIQCPACQTRFRLADDKIGPNGVSVRCSKCAHTFPVHREGAAGEPASPPAAAPATNAGFAPPPGPFGNPGAPPPGPFASAGNAPAPNPFGVPAAAAPTDPFANSGGAPNPFGGPGAGPPPDPFANAGFAPPPGVAPASPFAPPPPATQPPPAGFGPSGLPAGIPDPFAAMADGGAPPPGASMGGPLPGMQGVGDKPEGRTNPRESANAQQDPFASGAAANESTSPDVDPGMRQALLGGAAPGGAREGGGVDFDRDSRFAAEEAPADAALSLEIDRNDPAPASGGTGQGGTPSLASRPVRERLAMERDQRRRKKARRGVRQLKMDSPKEPRAAYRLLIGLFFAGAFVGAFASLTGGRFDPAAIDRARLALLIGPPPAAAEVSGLALRAREGGYLDTAPGSPRVFIARSVAVNNGPEAKGFLKVRGRLRSQDGKTLAETTVPCGNSFREEQLLELRGQEELSRAYLPIGDKLSNARIPPGSAVVCNVVFFDAPSPASVADFDVEIVTALPAT